MNKENADLIYEAPRWYPSLPVLRKRLAGAAAIPGGEPSGSRSLRLLAGQSQDRGVGDWGHKQTTNERMRVVPKKRGMLCWSLSFFIKAPMLIFREALEIFAHRCFAYFPLAKYAFLF